MPPNDFVTELQTGEREIPEMKKYGNVLVTDPKNKVQMQCVDIEVAPGIYQSKEDFEANMAYDEMRDEMTIDELLG